VKLCDDDHHRLDPIHPAITIVKTANPLSVEPGATVTYTYVVTNTGDTTLFHVSVDDDVLGHIGDIPQLDAGDSVTLTKDWELPRDELAVTNVGTATGTDVLDKTVTMSNLLLAALHRLDVPAASFGDSTGPLTELTGA